MPVGLGCAQRLLRTRPVGQARSTLGAVPGPGCCGASLGRSAEFGSDRRAMSLAVAQKGGRGRTHPPSKPPESTQRQGPQGVPLGLAPGVAHAAPQELALVFLPRWPIMGLLSLHQGLHSRLCGESNRVSPFQPRHSVRACWACRRLARKESAWMRNPRLSPPSEAVGAGQTSRHRI
jgi:hypothetical protein